MNPGLEFAPPPIAAFSFAFSEKDYDALSSVIYNLYGHYSHTLSSYSRMIAAFSRPISVCSP